MIGRVLRWLRTRGLPEPRPEPKLEAESSNGLDIQAAQAARACAERKLREAIAQSEVVQGVVQRGRIVARDRLAEDIQRALGGEVGWPLSS